MFTKSIITRVAAASAGLFALTGAAVAEDRQLTWSVTGAAYSDYVVRGYSQTDNDPAATVSLDLSYGIFYAGIYGATTTEVYNATNTEIDFYGGIKPVTGPVTWDFGVIYYLYPHQDPAFSGGLEVSFLELKAAASVSPVANLTTSITAYYSPDYSFETGNSLAVEGTAAYALPKLWLFSPTLSGTLGNQKTEDPSFFADAAVPTVDDYWYWNVGVALAVEKITFDLRYWDTNVDNTWSDSRFVAGAKLTLP